jgi:predicted nucleic acid-binding protein
MKMAAGVLIDTSFFITLADNKRKHNETARRYWKHFLENRIPIYLSTIVVSEFCVKQEIPPDILRCCIVLPFNWEDAQRAAKLDWKRLRRAGVERDALKDDIKIIAQAAVRDAEFVITDDKDTFFAYCRSFKDSGEVQFKTIKLEDGFDRAFFDPNGQRDFQDGLGEEDPSEK